MQGELRFVDPPAQDRGDQTDGFGAAVGQQQPAPVHPHGAGQGGGGGRPIRVVPDRTQVAGHHRDGVGRHRVEREGQVEHPVGVQPQRRGDSRAVPSVGPGPGDPRWADGWPHRRVLRHGSVPAASRPAAMAEPTSWDSRTARWMSRGSTARPSPSGGRSSTRSP